MKFRLTLIFAGFVLVLAAVTMWIARDRSTNLSPALASGPTIVVRAEPAVEPTTAPSVTETPPAPHKSAPMVQVDADGSIKYVARPGDTVSQLAIALLGSDSKERREAVIAANPSLQPNADLVLTGTTYSIVLPSRQEAAADAASARKDSADAPAASKATTTDKPATSADGPRLKYVAQEGDTVGVLAANLLGGDTKANRDSIIAGNIRLQNDPDHLVAGQTYTIVATNGLAANPNAPSVKAPTTQPDADEALKVGAGRKLRYTAQPGDSVSKLAVVLLGSDTPANRELIMKSNFGLKTDPDHLVAGQTYWITAPTADVSR